MKLSKKNIYIIFICHGLNTNLLLEDHLYEGNSTGNQESCLQTHSGKRTQLSLHKILRRLLELFVAFRNASVFYETFSSSELTALFQAHESREVSPSCFARVNRLRHTWVKMWILECDGDILERTPPLAKSKSLSFLTTIVQRNEYGFALASRTCSAGLTPKEVDMQDSPSSTNQCLASTCS